MVFRDTLCCLADITLLVHSAVILDISQYTSILSNCNVYFVSHAPLFVQPTVPYVMHLQPIVGTTHFLTVHQVYPAAYQPDTASVSYRFLVLFNISFIFNNYKLAKARFSPKFTFYFVSFSVQILTGSISLTSVAYYAKSTFPQMQQSSSTIKHSNTYYLSVYF